MRITPGALWKLYRDRGRAHAPSWMFAILCLAGIYNIAWGTFVVLFPNLLFHWAGMPAPNYPEIWQCVGMIVGVYGLGYIIAAHDPARHWPIVFVGFLGKFFGPIGMVGAVAQGRLPLVAGLVCATNDLIWWVPFLGALWYAWRKFTETLAPEREHGNLTSSP